MKERLLGAVGPMLGLALFAVSVANLHHELSAYHDHDVLEHLGAIPAKRLAAAGLLTLLSYVSLTGYDTLAFRWIRSPLRYSRIALASFIELCVQP